MSATPIVVIGASVGGVTALLRLASELPAGFPAITLVVQHIGAHPSALPMILDLHGNNRALHPGHGEHLEPGKIYVAPPDLHLLVQDSIAVLSRGPKEHHTRPAIDPLFRSAALAAGPRVIGVVLTGRLDDGAAGLRAIKACGGRVVVQDPETAECPDMPRSALQVVAPDACVPLEQMAATLLQLVTHPIPETPVPTSDRERLVREMSIFADGDEAMENLAAIGRPSTYTCPECSGVLWQIDDSRPPRFRCHTGHAYSLRSLEETQREATEEALWGAIRALQQREALLRRLAQHERGMGNAEEAGRREADADLAAEHARRLHALVEDDGQPEIATPS